MSVFDVEVRQFAFESEKIPLRMEGLTREQLLRRQEGRGNHILWILGHIATSRGYLLDWIGADGFPPVEDSENERFGIGCELKDGDPFPPTEELLDLLDTRGRALAQRLGDVDDREASRELDFELPFGNTVRAAVSFMLFHEAFHLGQLSYLCGLEGNPLGA